MDVQLLLAKAESGRREGHKVGFDPEATVEIRCEELWQLLEAFGLVNLLATKTQTPGADVVADSLALEVLRSAARAQLMAILAPTLDNEGGAA